MRDLTLRAEENDMTETNQEEYGMAMNQNDNGGGVEQWLSQHVFFIPGLLIMGSAVVSLVMALNKVRKIALWLIPVALCGAGILLAVKPLQERQTKIEGTQEQIISLLDQLDPVAKAQVAEYVAKTELGKI
jgi:hypothetical protein